jgi:hypothetical protein
VKRRDRKVIDINGKMCVGNFFFVQLKAILPRLFIWQCYSWAVPFPWYFLFRPVAAGGSFKTLMAFPKPAPIPGVSRLQKLP